jgi:hypothetical protein
MFYKVYYTHRFIPERFSAHNRGPFVFIRPQYRDDQGLLAHELIHVRQWYRNPLFGIFYRFSKAFRLRVEVEAYREQLKHCVYDRSLLFAQFLSDKYDLDITVQEARNLLLAPVYSKL